LDPAALAAEPDFRRLKRAIVDAVGLEYYSDKEQTLAERAEQQRNRIGCSRPDYLRRVLGPSGSEEMAALIDELTIGETYFFRYPAQFDALRNVVLPECLARRASDRTLRIWSAGCSSGAEPYSVAIMLRRDFAGPTAGWNIEILGTDINRKALAQARRGSFTDWELRESSDAMKSACFVEEERRWSLRPQYRDLVEFRYQNLVAEIDTITRDYAGYFDIILCRNVMIYFSPALMRRLVRLFNDCMARGGWLFVGHAEPYFEIASILPPVRLEGVTLYRRSDTDTAAAAVALPDPAATWAFPDDRKLDGEAFDEPDDAATLPRPQMPLSPAVADGTAGTQPAGRDAGPDHPVAAPDVHPAALSNSTLTSIRLHADAGQWDAAMEVCEEALQRYPMDPAVRYAHGMLCEQIGAPAAAEDAFGRAIYLDRNFALAHFHIGLCQVRRKDHKAARRSFSNAIRILDGREPHAVLEMSEGLTVEELRELTRIQMTALSGR
jgi:chemotaxis protein methyltransferase CheR